MPRDLIREAEAPVDTIGLVLLEAAEYLELHGWTRGSNAGPNGEACLMRAVAIAGHVPFVGLTIPYGFMREYESRLGFDGRNPAWAWNDAHGRTVAEVIARLRAAARGKL